MGRLGAVCALALFVGACASAEGSGADGGNDNYDASPGVDASANRPDATPSSLTLIRPNGGELFRTNTTEQIIWTTPGGIVGDIDIELWKGGAKIADIAMGETNDGTFDWSVPASLANGADYSVHIFAAADRNTTDASDADFAIDDRTLTITTPNGAESYTAGDVVDITWTTMGTIANVDLELHRGGTYLRDIALGASNTGTYSWTVDTDLPAAGDYTVVVKDAAGPVRDASDAVFAIANWQYRLPLTITAPVSLTNFQVIVELDQSNFTYANAQTDGSDIRFASDAARSNGFDLPHYRQTWAPPGTSRLWVRVPTLPAGSPVTIYMFYGISGQSDGSDFDATFPNQFTSSGSDSLNGTVNVDAYVVSSGHTVTVTAGAPGVINARIITVDGTINGVGSGYAGGTGGAAGSGSGGGGGSTNAGGGGGGYGGSGGVACSDSGDSPGAGGASNGSSSTQAIAMGSGGGGTDSAVGGGGGGAVTLNAAVVTVSGTINVGGANGAGGTGRNGGGGAGGGILIVARDATLSGMLLADGGDGGVGTQSINDDGGGGGGGRIKVFTVNTANDSSTKSVTGGQAGPNGDIAGADGNPGTLTSMPATTNEPTVAFGTEELVF